MIYVVAWSNTNILEHYSKNVKHNSSVIKMTKFKSITFEHNFWRSKLTK